MIILVLMWAAVWGIGIATKAPRQQRWIMMAVVTVAWGGLQLLLEDGHPAKVTADSLTRSVVTVGFLAVIVWLYRKFLGRMVDRAGVEKPALTPARPEQMGEAELNRYARHIILREIGGLGQKALREAKVLVVGAGGLGSPALQYLAAAGVGTIGVIDDDVVEATNLQRQVIHTDAMIDTPKVHSAAAAMRAQNPFVDVRPYHRRLTDEIAEDLIADYDLVLDGCDDMETRYLVNRICVAQGKPLISAALTQWEGQIGLYHAPSGPCYSCVFPQAANAVLGATCAEAGVAGPLPGVVGAMMAVEAVKHICGAGESLAGRLMIYDALYAETRVIRAQKRADCAVCG